MKHPCSTWQEWSPWSHCSTTCGKGAKIRARACSGSEGSCSSGKWTETKDCLLEKCIAEKEWQGWSEWSQCSSSCGKGLKIRARACSKGDGSCSGEPTETTDCLVDACPGSNTKPVITSQYQQWEEWSKCSTSCGKGSKIRARACSGSRGSCSGEPSEIRDCLEKECIGFEDKPKIKSQWQGWGEWSHCSLSCGNGARIRARACIGGHGSCSGEWTETKDCLLDKCPVIIGKWQEWGPWAQCSATCGKGAQIRARPCSKNDGSCPGEPTETKDCLLDKCPVKTSKWQEWGEWAKCSTTCGKGTNIRARACDKNGGSCPGEPTETKDCLVAECPGFPFCSINCFDFTLFQGQLLLQVLQHYHL